MTTTNFMYEKIYQDLLKKILDGSYPYGSRIPTEKELSQIYGVSRITSKNAVNQLAEQGYVCRTPGRGTFVKKAEDMAQLSLGEKKRLQNQHNIKKMIGVILDSFDANFGLLMLKSIEKNCNQLGYGMLLFCTYGKIEEENRAINQSIELGVKGLILMCVQNETYNPQILQMSLNGFPMVLVDRKMQGIPIPCVMTDNYKVARQLTKLLIDRGHKRLCFVTHIQKNTSTIRERYTGFVDEIVEHEDVYGCVAEISSYHTTNQYENVDELQLMDEESDTLLANNIECTGFLTVEARLGVFLCKAIQKECILAKTNIMREVVSVDKLELQNCFHAIAYAEQNETLIGKTAVEKLREIIEDKKVVESCVIDHTIVNGIQQY